MKNTRMLKRGALTNFSLTPSRTNFLHLVAFLLVCTMAFVSMVPTLPASHCDDIQEELDNARSDVDTYKREADEYKDKYDNASKLNPQKYYYYYMYHRALTRMHDAMNRVEEYEKKLKECEDQHQSSSGSCNSGGCN